MTEISAEAIEELRNSVQGLVGEDAIVEFIGPSPDGLRVSISVNPGYEVPRQMKRAFFGEEAEGGEGPWSHVKICFTVSGPGIPPHQECYWCDLSTNKCVRAPWWDE
jgi:hypothetical protein